MATITCKEFIDFLDDYFSQTQTQQVRDEFDRHLAECPDCVDYLITYQQSIRSCRALSENDETIQPPSSAPEELIRAILASRQKKH